MGAFDEIITKYGSPQESIPAAQARFSRAPISFVDFATLARNLGPFTVGGYDRSSKAIQIAPSASFGLTQGVVRHEDVHALLDSIDRGRTGLPPSLHSIPPTVLDRVSGSAPIDLDQVGSRSYGGGHFNSEIPAYMTAYSPGQLKGITPDMAQRWVNAYSQTLPDDARSKILRLGEISRGATSMGRN